MVRVVRGLAIGLCIVAVSACGGDDDDAAGDLAAYCEKAKVVDELEASSFNDATIAPEALKAKYEELVAAAEEAIAAAPAEIADELAVSKQAVDTLTALLETHDYDLVAVASDPGFEEMGQNADFEAAGQAVDAFNAAQCGITVD